MTKRVSGKTGERVIDGVGVSAGIAIGVAHVVETGLGQLPEYEIDESAVEAEAERFRAALAKAQKQVSKLRQKTVGMPDSVAEELAPLLDAHAAMLGSSRLGKGIETQIRERRINAEAAVQHVVHDIAEAFAAMKDPYLAARVTDVRDVAGRVLRNLADKPYQAFSVLPKDAVIIADELSPADTALLDPKRVAALATTAGGPEGHSAIMARSLGLPAVLGVQGLLGKVRSGDRVLVDGEHGRIVISPSAETLAEFERKAEARKRLERQLARLRSLPAESRDGEIITLQANLEMPRDVEPALLAGAEGVGLLRTEFLFMNRDSLPDEDEQYAVLRGIVEGLDGRPVTIRTLDVGGDKISTALGGRVGVSPNPALGLRGIRLSLAETKLFETQLAAILRAGAHGPVRLLLPLISSAEQIRQARKIITKVVRRLTRKGVRIADPVPPLGAMIEVPGAALMADGLAREVDYFAIGTNDLTSYALAIDRSDEAVAGLYNPLHPAVLRLIQFTVQAGHRAGIPVSICGEIAGDPRYAPLLVGLGVREFSMTSHSIPRVKQRIRAIDTGAATRRALAIMDQGDEGRISALLDDFNDSL
jgi:phosphotransferase system enzyme I (PtsI)